MRTISLFATVLLIFTQASHATTEAECRSRYERAVREINNPAVYSSRGAAKDAEFVLSICLRSAESQRATEAKNERIHAEYRQKVFEQQQLNEERVKERKIQMEEAREAAAQRQQEHRAKQEAEQAHRKQLAADEAALKATPAYQRNLATQSIENSRRVLAQLHRALEQEDRIDARSGGTINPQRRRAIGTEIVAHEDSIKENEAVLRKLGR